MEKIIRGDEELMPELAKISDREGEMIAAGLSSLTLYLTFLLGKDTFGIQVGEIREVIEYKKVFKVPGVPGFIKGVINLRGEVVPVIDLHSRFYNKTSDVINSTSIIVVEVDDENHKIPVGVMIDSVESVTGLQEESIEAVPEIGSRIRTDFIHGIGKVKEQFVILLKIQNILNLVELSDNNRRIN